MRCQANDDTYLAIFRLVRSEEQLQRFVFVLTIISPRPHHHHHYGVTSDRQSWDNQHAPPPCWCFGYNPPSPWFKSMRSAESVPASTDKNNSAAAASLLPLPNRHHTWGGGTGTKARSVNNRGLSSAAKHAYTPTAPVLYSEAASQQSVCMKLCSNLFK